MAATKTLLDSQNSMGVINSYQMVLASQGNRLERGEGNPAVSASRQTVKNRSFCRSMVLFSFSFHRLGVGVACYMQFAC